MKGDSVFPMRAVRFLTAIGIVGLCALVVPRGWDIVRFSMAANATVGSENRAEAVRPWNVVSGLAFSAREFSLTGLDESDDTNPALKRRDELTEILSLRPLSAERWLSLFEMRLATAEHSTKVEEAWGLSVLTGANEGYLMSERGLLGLLHWEVLPAEIQKRTASDLVARPPSDRRRARLRTILSEKTELVRQDIRMVLQAQGISPQGLAGFGL